MHGNQEGKTRRLTKTQCYVSAHTVSGLDASLFWTIDTKQREEIHYICSKELGKLWFILSFLCKVTYLWIFFKAKNIYK